MNLNKASNYNIGLDIGTGSVGWAVTDENGELYHFKTRPTWGSRLFPSADTAASARIPRGQRRRYDRRRQRLNWLQEFFLEEVEKVDPDFFIRLRQSRLLPEDREEGHSDYRWPLFNGSDFTERDYYEQFPTIYHLRKWLMETDEKADIRLIYLAFHNIVKTRGNFLHQDNTNLSAKNANMEESIERLCSALQEWCEEQEIPCNINAKDIQHVLENNSLSKKEKQEAAIKCFGFASSEKKRATSIIGAVLGYKVDFNKIFDIEAEGANFYLSNDEAIEAFYSQCPDNGVELYEALQAAYSSYVLLGILKGSSGQTISYCKVNEYEQYGEDLKFLKSLVREYRPDAYDTFFRGAHYEDERWKKDYDPSKAAGYTRYNLGTSKSSYEDFAKETKKLFEGTDAETDARYSSMIERFAETNFLRRLKTTDNGSIPFQLHLEEMHAIIEKQGKHYPFLLEEQEKIESLVSFRIPYYVGPLTTRNARRKNDQDPMSEMRFAWSERKEGKEDTAVHPWDWEEVIDKNKSAEHFIMRMTGTCTYIQGEPVLPRCSLMYEKFCVLNELNGAKVSFDGDKEYRLSYDQRMLVFENLFKRRSSVSYKAVEDYLRSINSPGKPHVRGGQGVSGFESKLSSHRFFCDVLGVEDLDEKLIPMVEETILWNTLFEDRSILRDKIQEKYGERLSDEQVKRIVKKRFTGWGRLSKKLLCELKAETANGQMSIMDILEEGNPEGSHIGSAMVLMEILHDEHFEFLKRIDQVNKENAHVRGGLDINDLPGSPALRRGVNQAMRIVDEIVSIAGCAPANIFIEVTRDDNKNKKGKRTTRRYDSLKEALNVLKEEGLADEGVLKQLNDTDAANLDDRLSLYFMQNGKCMYCGDPLDINRLSEYDIDHIIPRCYVKDDSFDNRVLVHSSSNRNKSDALLIDPAIRQKMRNVWRELFNAGLISEKKFNNLTRSKIGDKQLQGFINRQLVETSQIIKFVRMMLEEKYPETRIESIKASLSHQLRDEQGFIKCREANSYHHAHDALLAAEIGRFIQLRHPGLFENPIGATKVMKEFIRSRSEYYKKFHKLPGSATFIIGSFLTSGFDKETGEIYKDTWDADVECSKIRRYLNYKDCFISRMPEITSGAFWDATIYSPKGQAKDLSLPLKKGLDPKKYGSYSREQFAYFFIYKATKKDKPIIEFAPVPVSVASLIEKNPESLDEYAKEHAANNNLVFEKTLRSKVYKYQLIELDGSRLYITGKKEVRNASELAFSLQQINLISDIVLGKEIANESIDNLFEAIVDKYQVYAAKLGAQLGVASMREQFTKAPVETKKKIIQELLAIANASKNMIDISDIGGAKHAGCMLLSYQKIFTDDSTSISFIDQSVTGMFERRQRIEL